MAHGDNNPNTAYCTALMTSNTTPSPNVVSADPGSSTGWRAFNQNVGDEWYAWANAPKWVCYDFGAGNGKVVNKYALNSSRTSNSRWPTGWNLQGSNNGSNWTTLDTRSGVAWPGQYAWTAYCTFENSTAYRYYKLYVPGSQPNECCISEIKLVEQLTNEFQRLGESSVTITVEAQVLGGEFSRGGVSAIGVTTEAAEAIASSWFALSPFTVTDDLSVIGPVVLVASAALDLAASAHLAVSQTAEAVNTLAVSAQARSANAVCEAANAFALVDISDVGNAKERLVGTEITILAAASGEAAKAVTSPVALATTATCQLAKRLVSVIVGLSAVAQVANSSRSVSASSVLQTTTVAVDPDALKLIEIDTGLSVSAMAEKVVPAHYSIQFSVGAISDVGLAVDVDRQCQLRRTVESSIALTQSAAYWIDVSSVLYQYHPFIGAGASDAPSPPPSVLAGPLDGIMAPFQLVHPATGQVTDFVTLRTPNLGNKDRLSFNRVLRETRGGTLIVYADPMWPKIQTLVLSFSGLGQNEARELLAFFDGHLGQEIGLIDWKKRYWRGVVVTPDEPIVEDSRGSFSASFQFEGELDETWSPANL